MAYMRQRTSRPGWVFLRSKRIAARMTLRDLAAATGYSVQFHSNLETGLRGCSDEALFRIADIIGVRPEALHHTRPVVPPRCKPASTEGDAKAVA